MQSARGLVRVLGHPMPVLLQWEIYFGKVVLGLISPRLMAATWLCSGMRPLACPEACAAPRRDVRWSRVASSAGVEPRAQLQAGVRLIQDRPYCPVAIWGCCESPWTAIFDRCGFPRQVPLGRAAGQRPAGAGGGLQSEELRHTWDVLAFFRFVAEVGIPRAVLHVAVTGLLKIHFILCRDVGVALVGTGARGKHILWGEF